MIKVLDSFIADKIAAGEVIERPLSIVKELVENSIDAGADKIIVEIRNGGKSLIRVTDNGSGIQSDEVELAFERHATGKISKITDLDSIKTLGFRGEALASIAAISRLTIFTKTNDAKVGAKAVLHGGRLVSREPVGCNDGTTIVCEDVFYNTPARRKFMRSDAAETSVIIDLIQKFAIYYSNIAFRMISNGNNILSTDGDSDTLKAIQSIFSSSEYKNIIEIKNDMVHGYISDPGTTKSSKRGQIFFVNGRIVTSSAIEKGIAKGYGDRIFQGFPIAILFIEVDPSSIDVNIHPNKKEIKFLDEKLLVDKLSDAISAVMNTKSSVPSAMQASYASDQAEIKAAEEQLSIREYLKKQGGPTSVKAEPDELPKKIVLEDPVHDDSADEETAEIVEYEDDSRIEIIPSSHELFDFEDLRIKGYVFDAYIICESGDSLYILDQHAAHERIFYERLVDAYNSEEKLSQPILSPYTIDVSSDLYHSEESFLTELLKMGYDISDFGSNTYIVRGIPTNMTLDESALFAKDFIESCGEAESINSLVVEKLIMKSCKSAVKANDRLSEIEINELINTLSSCKNPFSCPHGRPTFIKVTKYDIERAFKRK